MRTVQDIDPVHKNLEGYEKADEFLQEKGRYDGTLDRAFNRDFSESARGTLSKSAIYVYGYVVLNTVHSSFPLVDFFIESFKMKARDKI